MLTINFGKHNNDLQWHVCGGKQGFTPESVFIVCNLRGVVKFRDDFLNHM